MRNGVFIGLQSKLARDPDELFVGSREWVGQITAGITQLTQRVREH